MRVPLPPWVVVLDVLTLALVVVLFLMFEYGGYRERFGPVVVTVRSWRRVALLAIAAATFRHALWRRPSLPELIVSVPLAMWRSQARRAAWGPFVATRLGVLLVGYLAVVLVGYEPDGVRFRFSNNEFANLPARWDAGWYLGIIMDGYFWDGDTARERNVVFFPAFPMTARIVGLIIGERWVLAATIVPTLAFLGALTYLYRLAREMLDDERARATLWLLATYPFAIYYSVPYTEGLYLLSCAGTFYHAWRGEWTRAALWGMVVGLCRPNGFLIAVPMFLLIAERAMRERRLRFAPLAALAGPAAGLGLYCAYLWLRFGDPLAWAKGQAAWNRVFKGFWPGLHSLVVERYDYITANGFYNYTSSLPLDFLYSVAALFVLVSVVPSMRRFGLAFGTFTIINIGPPLLAGGMMSIGRMTSVLFPAFLWLAAIVPARQLPAWLAVFSAVQGLIAVLFFTWRPVF